jgi:hypothetical protein
VIAQAGPGDVRAVDGRMLTIQFEKNPGDCPRRRENVAANAVRPQLHALAYNLANFLWTLALPDGVEKWSLTCLREKLVKIAASGRGCHAARSRGTATSAIWKVMSRGQQASRRSAAFCK